MLTGIGCRLDGVRTGDWETSGRTRGNGVFRSSACASVHENSEVLGNCICMCSSHDIRSSCENKSQFCPLAITFLCSVH